MSDLLISGFIDVLTPLNLMYILAGVIIGQIVGATPGLSIVMALAIAVPLTFSLDTLTALAFLISVNKGGTVGGAVPAILLNVPGTPEAAATTLDGYPMAKRGQPIRAMKYALYYSFAGDISSDVVLILVAAPLAVVALKMGPIETTCLMIFAFTIIAGLVGNSMIKGLIATALGFLLASVGLDPGAGTPRFTYGLIDLYDGLNLASVSLGALALSEIILSIAATRGLRGAVQRVPMNKLDREANRVSVGDLLAHKVIAIRSFLIGTAIGAIPGLGSTTAGFLSYSITKQTAPQPELLGKGDPRGIASSETANSAVVGANLIPLLTLGIPGNIAAAMLVSAFIIHGMQPGPLLFQEQGQLIYGMFAAMLIANFANLGVGQIGMRFWSIVTSAPDSVLFPGAMLMCIAGAYAVTGSVFGIYVMLAATLLGVFMHFVGMSVIPFIVAFILTPQLEQTLVQTLLISNGDIGYLFAHPIAIAFLLLSLASLYFLGFKRKRAEPSLVEGEH